MRKYESIWLRIKEVPVSTIVEVKIHKSHADTLRRGVWKEKTRETGIRKKLGMRFAGRLEINQRPVPGTDSVILSFALSWDGTRI